MSEEHLMYIVNSDESSLPRSLTDKLNKIVEELDVLGLAKTYLTPSQFDYFVNSTSEDMHAQKDLLDNYKTTVLKK